MPAAHDMAKLLSAAALARTWIEEHDIGDAFGVTAAPWDQARPRNGLFCALLLAQDAIAHPDGRFYDLRLT